MDAAWQTTRRGWRATTFVVTLGVLFGAVSLLAAARPASAATPDQLLQKAVRAYSQSQWGESAESFAAFLSAAPQDRRAADARYFRAEALLQTDASREADSLFAQLESQTPPGRWTLAARFRRGEKALADGRVDDAKVAFTDCLTRSTDLQHQGYSLVYLAEIALASNDAEAFAKLDAAAERLKKLPAAQVDRYQRLAARADLARADLTSSDASRELVRRAAARLQDHARFGRAEDEYLRAVAAMRLESYDDALRSLLTLDAAALPSNDQGELPALLAQLHVQLEQHDQAARVLAMLVELQPEREDADWCRGQLTMSLAALGRWSEAAWWWEKEQGVKESTSSDESRETQIDDRDEWRRRGLTLADGAYGAGDWESAAQIYTTLAEQPRLGDSETSRVLTGLAWCRRKQERYVEAARHYQRWLDTFPKDPQRPTVALVLAETRWLLGEEDEAIALYRLVADWKPAASETPAALLALARHQRRTQTREQAEATLRHLIAEFPQFRQLEDALYEQAWLLAELERRDLAERAWRRLVAEFPQGRFAADACYRLACLAERRGDAADARHWIARLAKTQTDEKSDLRQHALHLEARLLAREGAWEEIANRMSALSQQAGRVDVRLAADYWVAEGLFQRARYREAAERLQRLENELSETGDADRAATESSPSVEPSASDDEWRVQVSRRRAESLAKLGEWTSALQVAESVQSRHRDFRWNYEMDFVRGQCLAALGRDDEARAAWQAVVRSPMGGRSETAAAAQWQIGQSWELAGNLPAAITAFETVERLFPTSDWRTRATIARGYCLERTGDTKAAVRCFAEVIREQGSNAWSQEAEAGLRRARKAALTRDDSRPSTTRR